MLQPDATAATAATAVAQAMVAVLHWTAGLVVLAEGLNKLHRADPLRVGLAPLVRTLVLLKVSAWILLVLGAGGAVVRPLVVVAIGADLTAGPVRLTDRVSLADLCVLGGFAILILRSRLKEPRQALKGAQ